MPQRKKLILVVIDGLTPGVFEDAVAKETTPALAFLAAHGSYGRGISPFPSLTPVCLSSIATGSQPDVHGIPHLVWYHRGERRVVEYGSSFAAIRAAGTRRSILDAIFNMNEQHLRPEATTVYEDLEDAGLTAAAVNVTCYRGRTRHRPLLPWLTRPAYGPKRFFFFNLYESDVTGAPVAVFGRSGGSIDAYAAAVGRWLVTRDAFDFLSLLPPGLRLRVARARTGRRRGGARPQRRGGRRADRGGRRPGRVPRALRRGRLLGPRPDARRARGHAAVELRPRREHARDRVQPGGNGLPAPGLPRGRRRARAAASTGPAPTEVALYREGDEAVARRDGAELRFSRSGEGWSTSGDTAILDQPDALERAWCALANPNAGELIVSPPLGLEFADLAGRSHKGGGSHGSLEAGDSEVPMLTVGLDGARPERIVDVKQLVLGHFGVRARKRHAA